MRILAIDTSTWVCAAALLRDGVVLAARDDRAESHAARLADLVESVFDDARERLEPGDAIALSIGPGSFTGLRIGLSLAKGMAFAGDLRVVGVPTLDAWAVAAPTWEGRLCTVLDARKREVYAAVYERTNGQVVRCGAPCALAATRLAETLASTGNGACTFIGDAVDVYGEVFREILGSRAGFFPPDEHLPRAPAVGRLGAARLAGFPGGDPLAELVPTYVRPPEAELKQSATGPSRGASAPTFVDKVPLLY